MPKQFMTPIEPGSVSAQEPFDPVHQIGFGSLDHQFLLSLVATTRGPDLAYFGGSRTLRYGLAKDNCAGLGPDGYDLATLAASQHEASHPAQ